MSNSADEPADEPSDEPFRSKSSSLLSLGLICIPSML